MQERLAMHPAGRMQRGRNMQVCNFSVHDSELGAFHPDHRLPLVRLREKRRELVISLEGAASLLTRDRIREIAEVQQAIRAIEAVIAE